MLRSGIKRGECASFPLVSTLHHFYYMEVIQISQGFIAEHSIPTTRCIHVIKIVL